MINKRTFTPLLIFIVFLPFLVYTSCKHDPQGIDKFDTVCFQTQILPILQSSCGITGCHDGSGEVFTISSYNDVRDMVSPGNAGNSQLYKVITAVNGNLMPPNHPLTKDQRTLIEIWIQQGANNTQCSSNSQSTDSVYFVQNIEPIFQSNCGKVSCHDFLSSNADYVLTNYNTIMQSTNGIIPYKPDSGRISWVINTNRMPLYPNPNLTIRQKDLIKRWITDGALNSNCTLTKCDSIGTITFSQKIQPLIQDNCFGCHNPSDLNGNVDFSNYTQIKLYSESFRFGVPIIIGALKHESGFKPMPPSGTLNKSQIRTIELWISQGMLNN